MGVNVKVKNRLTMDSGLKNPVRFIEKSLKNIMNNRRKAGKNVSHFICFIFTFFNPLKSQSEKAIAFPMGHIKEQNILPKKS